MQIQVVTTTLLLFKFSCLRKIHSFKGILFEISGIHKANSWNSDAQKIMYVLLIRHRLCFTALQTGYVGDRVSLIIPFVIETQNTDFLQDSFTCNNNSAKKCKEIHNIVASHLLTPTLLRVFAVQCERKLSSLTDHAKRRKQHLWMTMNLAFRCKPGGTQANRGSISTWTASSWAYCIRRYLVIVA